MVWKIITLLFFFYTIKAQIALPTFQGIHNNQNNITGTPEYPLQAVVSGLSLDYNDATWDYSIGYRFTPNVNGTITQLGGSFDGGHTVRLWKRSDGSFLGSVVVSDPNNSWSYVDLSSSVSVTSGDEYVVMVYSNSNGMHRYRITGSFPQTAGNITINYSCYVRYYNSDNYPSSWTHETRTDYVWGVPDITFVPDS